MISQIICITLLSSITSLQSIMSSPSPQMNTTQGQERQSTSTSPSPQQNSKQQQPRITSSAGVEMTTYTTYEARLPVHPDHVGFVIGKQGATVRQVGSKNRVDAKLNRANGDSWPFIRIRGNMTNVEAAFLEIRGIANTANQRIPRINQQQQHHGDRQHSANRQHHGDRQRRSDQQMNMTNVATITDNTNAPPDKTVVE